MTIYLVAVGLGLGLFLSIFFGIRILLKSKELEKDLKEIEDRGKKYYEIDKKKAEVKSSLSLADSVDAFNKSVEVLQKLSKNRK